MEQVRLPSQVSGCIFRASILSNDAASLQCILSAKIETVRFVSKKMIHS